MHDGLAAPIGARAIVRRPNLGRRSPRGTALVRHPRATNRATYARNLTGFGHRGDDVTALFTTSSAHLLDSISDCKSLFLFHIALLKLTLKMFCPGVSE